MRYSWKAVFTAILLVLLFSVFSITVQAQDNQTKIDKAYEWLVGKASEGWGSIESNAFSVMALNNFDSSLANQGLQNLLDNSKNDGECWPSTSCRIKDTALAAIALNELDSDTSKAKAWLLSRQKLFLEQGNWFLQLHIFTGENNGTFNVEYVFGEEVRQDTVFIRDDRKVELERASLCFDVLSSKPYWLHIKDLCLQTEFAVSSEEPEWFASLLFVIDSPLTLVPFPKITSPGTLKITSKCFPNTPSGSCEYDASMWATYALDLLGEDAQTKAFLESGADANKPLSYALLFLIGGEIDFAGKLAAEQNAQGFWNGAERFFRTAIAYLSVRNIALDNLDLPAARNWLFDNQNDDFSWGSTQKQRDTAAVLFGVFPTGAPLPPPSVQRCVDFGNVCCPTGDVKVGSQEFSELSCVPSFGKKCVAEQDCEVQVEEEEETCFSKNGVCCDNAAAGAVTYGNLDCSFGEICASSCEIEEEEDTCFDVGGKCCEEAASGADRYPSLNSACGGGDVCVSECKTSKGLGGLVWFLGILVVIAVVVLIFLLRRRKKGKGEPALPGLGRIPPLGPPSVPTFRRPPTPRGPPITRPVGPRPVPRPPRPIARPVAKKGKTEEELEKTLKKLREIK